MRTGAGRSMLTRAASGPVRGGRPVPPAPAGTGARFQRDARGGVAELRLDRLHARALRDEQTRAGVPEMPAHRAVELAVTTFSTPSSGACGRPPAPAVLGRQANRTKGQPSHDPCEPTCSAPR